MNKIGDFARMHTYWYSPPLESKEGLARDDAEAVDIQ